MGVLKGILWTFLGFLLVVSLLVSVTLLTANTLLYPDIYVKAIDESGGASGVLADATEGIDEGEFVNTSNEEFDAEVEKLITNFLSYLRGETNELDLAMNIDSDALRAFLEEQVEGLPACGSGEELSSLEGDILCKPVDKTSSEFLTEVLAKNNITFPDSQSVDLAEFYDLESSGIEEIRSGVSMYRMAIYLFIFLSIVFSVLIFIAARDVKKGTMILGIDLVVAGIIVFASSFITSLLVNAPDFGIEILTGLINSVKGFIVTRQNLYGVGLVVSGGILVGVSVFLKKSEGKSQTKALK